MSKVSYHILALEIEKLYAQQFPLDDLKAIEDHIAYIATFIRSCGWTEEEFLERWLQESGEAPPVYLPAKGTSN